MAKQPLVSVLCLSYNQKQYIRQCLDSMLMQKANFPFEILINDDASTDGTKEIIKEYQKKHPDIVKPVFHKENQYSQGKRNMIIRFLLPKARGKYIALCEGDDYWTDPQKLQKQVDFLEKHKDYALVFHPVRVFFEGREQPDSIFPDFKSGFTLKRLLQGNFIQTNSVMYKRQTYKGMSVAVVPGDWYLHLYHAKFGKIGFIPEVMSAYRRHPGGIWWDEFKNRNRLLLNHGMNILELYKVLLKFFGKDKMCKAIILNNAVNQITAVMMAGDSRLNKRIIEQYPDFMEYLVKLNEENRRKLYEEHLDRDRELSVLTDERDRLTRRLHESVELNQSLLQSKTFRLGRAITLPPRIANRALRGLTKRVKQVVTSIPATTIVVPVYDDWGSLNVCIESLKESVGSNAKCTVIFINDCGPHSDQMERDILHNIKGYKRFHYFRNPYNLGFVRTCNRAVYELDTSNNNVLLLNSDTRVTRGFLPAMVGVLYSDSRIATVTPRSNHATIFSIPYEAATQPNYPMDKSYELYEHTKARLPDWYESPTGHGFCMLIRRKAIKEYGFFDEVYGKGYGEESDFCMRLRQHGYTNVITNRAYVFHYGSRSFSHEGREEGVRKNSKILLRRYPDYNQLVEEYIQRVVIPEQELFRQ